MLMFDYTVFKKNANVSSFLQQRKHIQGQSIMALCVCGGGLGQCEPCSDVFEGEDKPHTY